MANPLGGIDPLAALAALGVTRVTRTKPVPGGMDTLIWHVVSPDGEYALRLFRPEQLDQSEEELQVMQAMEALGVPVPRIVSSGVWEQRPAILMEWCHGSTLMDEARAHPDRIDSLGVSMGRMQADLHARSLPTELWDDHRSWMRRAGPGEEELYARLRAAGLRDGHPLHIDFHPRNVLCDGHEATVILDWANAAVGDPRADVARTQSILRFAATPPSSPETQGDSIPARLERAWMTGYTEAAGTLADFALFEIWAGMTFIRDMEKYVGRSDFWMDPSDFDRVRQEVRSLKRQLGFENVA